MALGGPSSNISCGNFEGSVRRVDPKRPIPSCSFLWVSSPRHKPGINKTVKAIAFQSPTQFVPTATVFGFSPGPTLAIHDQRNADVPGGQPYSMRQNETL